VWALLLVVPVVSAAKGKGKTGAPERKQLEVDDPEVAKASEFAMRELRKYCDYCNVELKATYQNLLLKKMHKAESLPTQLAEGTMYFLQMTMESSVPYIEKSKDTQEVIVFQKADGSYDGISVERSPFLET
jgi:hypothetical protein